MSLASLVDTLADAYWLLLIFAIILTWVPHNPYHPAIRWVRRVTEPVLRPFRGLIPPVGMVDISPIVLALVYRFAQNIVVQLLYSLGL